MPRFLKNLFFVLVSINLHGQAFVRSELPTILSTPWEMTYGPDGFL